MNILAVKTLSKAQTASAERSPPGPILILTIANGAGHTQAAKAIASAWQQLDTPIPARVIDVSDFMSPLARFTHVTAYLWLVKNAPAVWEKIDNYQKKQTQTSPEWFYRRECRKLFDLAREIQPSAIVATEVGCGEIAALIKRDLQLQIPLVAVNPNYEADRAWVQPEVDLYCLVTNTMCQGFVRNGARTDETFAWGVPMQPKFAVPSEYERADERQKICKWLDLEPDTPLILISGGGEGLGKIEEITKNLLQSEISASIIVLAGNNKRVKGNCEKLKADSASERRLRVVGWTNRVPELFRTADIMVSKLGNTFDEAMACGLPIVALPPPPGAERVQYETLEKLGVGRGVQTVAEAVATVIGLLKNNATLEQLRKNAAKLGQNDAAAKVALWLRERVETRYLTNAGA